MNKSIYGNMNRIAYVTYIDFDSDSFTGAYRESSAPLFGVIWDVSPHP